MRDFADESIVVRAWVAANPRPSADHRLVRTRWGTYTWMNVAKIGRSGKPLTGLAAVRSTWEHLTGEDREKIFDICEKYWTRDDGAPA